MIVRTYLDWLPYSSPAIQTNLIHSGVLNEAELHALLNSRLGSFVCYALRLDGIFVFSIFYRDPPPPQTLSAHCEQIADHLRRGTFGFKFLPARATRRASIVHRPAAAEDIYSNGYMNRMTQEIQDVGPLIPPNLQDPVECLLHLNKVAGNDALLCLIRREHADELKSRHFCCLYLKALMGKRKNSFETAWDNQLILETNRKNFMLNAASFVGFLLLLYILIGIAIVFYEWYNAIDYGGMTLFQSYWTALTTEYRYLLGGLLSFGAVWFLFLLHWRYQNSYKRRIFILTHATVYFANCCQYAACVSQMYDSLSERHNAASTEVPMFYGHQRSFEGIMEELKIRLQNEHIRFRDLGIRYGINTGVLSFIARSVFVS